MLLVDDEPDARELLTEVLQQCGAVVVATHSADEAVRLIPRERPAVLLSDIGLPGEDGYKLISRVRALPPEQGGNLPAAAITAYARSDDARRALRGRIPAPRAEADPADDAGGAGRGPGADGPARPHDREAGRAGTRR